MIATRVLLCGLILPAACIVGPRAVRADYMPMSLLMLVGTAEQIVVGRITVVEQVFVSVRIEDTVVGTVNAGDVIRVRRFNDWACAWRWAPYEVDQRVLLFLDHDQGDPTAFRILGAGCEGESRVVDDRVEPNFGIGSPGTVLRRQPDVPRLSHPLAPLCAAIADCRAAYRFTLRSHPHVRDAAGYTELRLFSAIDQVSTAPARRGTFQPRHPPGAAPPFLPFASRSPFHQFLAEEIAAECRRIEPSRNSPEIE